ncbi:MAG TPA: hypothetical protein VHI50_08985 [Micromonosporaceae bacterium]|nr:hypothetical protein [Micromonosporaceae bacterium]
MRTWLVRLGFAAAALVASGRCWSSPPAGSRPAWPATWPPSSPTR